MQTTKRNCNGALWVAMGREAIPDFLDFGRALGDLTRFVCSVWDYILPTLNAVFGCFLDNCLRLDGRSLRTWVV